MPNPAGNAGAACHHFAQVVESALPELFGCPIVGWKRWFILRGIRWFVERRILDISLICYVIQKIYKFCARIVMKN